MPITVIKGPEGVRTVFSAVETITQLRTVQIASGFTRSIMEAVSGYPELGLGVAAESVASGDLARIITGGYVSGVICASGVSFGDILQAFAASGLGSGTGHVAPQLSGQMMIGKAAMSGGRGSGIGMIVDFGPKAVP
ncbi:MAG TPA: hypothetical protein VMW64_04515 [Dehalococcoidia bacterium]|nr:hypothetical protein [Dehalococcoidia bacterium]